MPIKPNVLVVDDDESILASLSERLVARGFEVSTAASGEEALRQARRRPDIVLLDLHLPQGDGLYVLRSMREEGLESTVIVITAYGTVEKAVEAMKEGAYDFLQKPFEPALIEETIRRALERHSLRRENLALREAISAPGLVVAGEKMQAVLAMARKASTSDATVLLMGESGTGKEVLANQLHAWSARAEGPFVAVNCVALAETLLESELFGHEKGAFTGATSRKKGKIELAHRGTLFLDEIGDISPSFQAKLLRVLQERSFERVGGTEPIQVDVRVLAATNCDLKKRVAAGEFREDLFYRLNVISITLPALRERRDDVPALAEHFLERFAREAKRPGLRFSPEALQVLCAHTWPGNIRELRNALERAIVLCEGDEIAPPDLPPELLFPAEDEPAGGFHQQVEAFRKNVIEEALHKCSGNQTRAAELLGLQRTYLARLIRQLRIR